MRLSGFGRFILISCFGARGKLGRAGFSEFFKGKEKKPKDLVDTVTKAMERLIDKGWLVGYGVRTPKKWYIKEVKLTPLGRRLAKKLRGEQQKLPL